MTSYVASFRRMLNEPNSRLMIIGYGFGDQHINAEIENAAKDSDLRLFIVDPNGIDVLDKPTKDDLGDQRLVDRFGPSIMGASRRRLLSIFNDDYVEHAKIWKFFAS